MFTGLTNLYDILQLGFTDLCSREVQLTPTADRLRLLQFLNLCLASRNKFGLMRCLVLSFSLAFSPFGFLVVRFAFVLQATKTLTYRSGSDTSLFL